MKTYKIVYLRLDSELAEQVQAVVDTQGYDSIQKMIIRMLEEKINA
jgi:hypothetical protein